MLVVAATTSPRKLTARLQTKNALYTGRGHFHVICKVAAPFPQAIMLMGVHWCLAYPLSYRYVEELLEERGVDMDHAALQRWVVKERALSQPRF
jgi:hypothetical protein